MTSKVQYDVYWSAFAEEAERYSELKRTASTYVAICTFFLGALGFHVAQPSQAGGDGASLLLLAGSALFLISFILVILSLGVFKYAHSWDPAGYVALLDADAVEPADEEFLEDRIADLVAATAANAKVSDRRAFFLAVASYAMVLGALISFAGFVGGSPQLRHFFTEEASLNGSQEEGAGAQDSQSRVQGGTVRNAPQGEGGQSLHIDAEAPAGRTQGSGPVEIR